MFNPKRLELARKRRGLTKKELSERINLQPRSISAYENGEFEPSPESIEILARALAFPKEFFEGEDLDTPSLECVSFRAMSKMTAGKRDAALSAGSIAFALNGWVEEKFTLPSPDLLDLRGENPEAAAEILRRHWGLGQLSIGNILHLLEAKGVRVFSLVENAVEVDAFSLWRDNKPYVFLNTIKSAEHSRFDAAHELGHLILHKHAAPHGQDAEKEANEFASAFLMPRSSIIAAAPRLASLNALIHLKKKWIVSVAALTYRLHRLNIISEWHYRMLCIEMSEKGYRKSEPLESQRERSKIWEMIFGALNDEGVTKEQVAKALNVYVSEIEKLIFGLVVIDNHQAPKTSAGKKNVNLRLIK